MSKKLKKKITFNDLIKFSPPVKNIMNWDNTQIRIKNSQTINREFNVDKWGDLKNRFLNNEIKSLHEADSYIDFFNENIAYLHKKNFYISSGKDIFDEHLYLYYSTLKEYATKNTPIVELGAGYGSKILNLALNTDLKYSSLHAAEYTDNGIELMKLISKRENLELEVGRCNFYDYSIDGVNIPENSIIFTSFSLHYIKKLNDRMIDFFLNLKPKVVINFEPCFEAYSSETIHGLMCQRYIFLNDYNTNFLSLIIKNTKKKNIYSHIEKNIIGSNPLLPLSIIKWSKVDEF